MWLQAYDPLHSTWLSAIVAALPIVLFLVLLTVVKMTGLKAAVVTVLVTLVLGIFVFGMPVGPALMSGVFGIVSGLWPIGWIVLMAVWLYRVTVRAGNFEVIRGSITSISADQRVQVLLIAFGFGAFLEGAAGFGIPIAICAALLVNLGFEPLRAAMLSLVANAAAGAYGAIGIPVIVGAQQGGVDAKAMNVSMVLASILVSAAIPMILMLIMDGLKGLRETFPVAIVTGLVYAGLQALVMLTLGPELADIIPGLGALITVALMSRAWRPKNLYREPGAPEPETGRAALGGGAIARAWSPFVVLSVVVLLWSLPVVKNLFLPGGALSWSTLTVKMPGLNGEILKHAPIAAKNVPMPAVWTVSFIGAAGTAILIAVLLTVLTTKTISWAEAGQELGGTVKQLWQPISMICLVMAVANVMSFSGMSSALGLALAAVGGAFPLISPIIGWIGVFVTGSVTNSNTLFAGLQSVTAHQIGANPTLMVAGSTTGGIMGKVVSPQSIAIATAAVDRSGHEGEVTNMALKYSLMLLAFVCVWVLLLSLVTS